MLVVGGAELFFEAVVASAARLRMPAFAVTVLVSGFELENLAAGIAANLEGLPGAAAGTFLGGTTFLALAVAGLSGIVAPISARLPGAALAWTAASPLLLLVLSLDHELSRLDGALLVVWFVIAIAGVAHAGRALPKPEARSGPRWPVARLLAGLAVLAVGGALLGEGIRRLVSRAGISETLLGNTAIAASVEAEEIGRVAVPSRRGRGDVALGNVLGTIVHFVALNSGVIALVKPLRLDSDTVRLHLPVAAGSALFVCALLALRRGISRRVGLLLAFLYVAYVGASIAAAT